MGEWDLCVNLAYLGKESNNREVNNKSADCCSQLSCVGQWKFLPPQELLGFPPGVYSVMFASLPNHPSNENTNKD